MGTQTAVPATDKQTAFLRTLAGDRAFDADYRTKLIARLDAGDLSKNDASRWITYALGLPRVSKPAASPTAPSIWDEVNAALADVDTSFYAIPADYLFALGDIDLRGNDYLFINVRNYKGKRVRRVQGSQGDFNYIPIRRPQTLIALANIIKSDARVFQDAWHAKHGTCGRCNAGLTDRVSRERGYGPECIKFV